MFSFDVNGPLIRVKPLTAEKPVDDKRAVIT
jgi:hypothetical protein